MKITKTATDSAILAELGIRLAQKRLAQNLTQLQLAKEAGISQRTVRRLESGAVATQLTAFLRTCRVLNLIDRLELLVPEPTPSPIAQLKLRGRERRRASGRTPATPGAEPGQAPWTWNDQP